MPEPLSRVYADAQALLNDTGKAVFTDNFLQPYVMLAYRKIIDEIAAHHLDFDEALATVTYTTATTPPTDLSTQTGYPTDMWQPLLLRERKDSTEQWVDMAQVRRLAARDPDTRLIEWEWRGNVIYVLGATENRQVEIRYEQIPAELLNPTDALKITGGEPILSHLAAAYAARVRGQRELAGDFETEGTQRLETLISRMVAQQQYAERRPRPFRTREVHGAGRWVW